MISKKRHSKSVFVWMLQRMIFCSFLSPLPPGFHRHQVTRLFHLRSLIRSFVWNSAQIICTHVQSQTVLLFLQMKRRKTHNNGIELCAVVKPATPHNQSTLHQQQSGSNDAFQMENAHAFRCLFKFKKASMFISIQTHFAGRICWFTDFIQIKRNWWVRI